MFITNSQNFPFLLSLSLLVGLTLIEGLGILVGIGIFPWLNKLCVMHAWHDGVHDHGLISEFFSWMKLKEVPFAIFLILFLLGFGIIGLWIQYMSFTILGHPLHRYLASIIAVMLSLPAIRLTIQGVNACIPKGQNSPVSLDSYIGQQAVIILGEARHGLPAQAKLQDQHQYAHYLMVEPDEHGEQFIQGDRVLIVSRKGSIYQVIQAPATY